LNEKLALKSGRKQLFSGISAAVLKNLPILVVTLSSVIVCLVAPSLLFIATGLMSPPDSSISSFDAVSAAVDMATNFWIAGSGGQLVLDNLSIDVVLLGISLFSFVVCYFMIKLRRPMSVTSLHFGAFCYTVIVILISCFLGVQDVLHILRVVIISYFISFTAYLAGNSSYSISDYLRRTALPSQLYAPLYSAAVMVLSIITLTSLAYFYGLSTNLKAAEAIFESLNAGPWEAILISFLELGALPNFVFWTVGALFSTGFSFAGSVYAFTNSTPATFSLPILSAVTFFSGTQNSSSMHFLLSVILLALGLLSAVWLFVQTSKEPQLFFSRSRFFKQDPHKLVFLEILNNFIYLVLTITVFFLMLVVLGVISSGYIYDTINSRVGVQVLVTAFSIVSKVICSAFAVFAVNSMCKVVKSKKTTAQDISDVEVAKSGIIRVAEVKEDKRGNRRVGISIKQLREEAD
jgi:hypothetical protein